MLTILHPTDYLHLLKCPCSDQSSLAFVNGGVFCDFCKKQFRVTDGPILELVDPDTLDSETARELRGNTYRLTKRQMAQTALAERADVWQSYYSRNRKKSIQYLSKYLDSIQCDRVISLGSGTGREIEQLFRFRKFSTVLCSDLSSTALRIVPYRLQPFDIKLGMFTSDLNTVCVKHRDIPIIIVRALHHTQSMHRALEKLLAYRYKNILFIEPTNNVIIKYLAKKGISQRIEYSGVRPGRLDLGRLRKLCQEYDYSVSIRTRWVVPEDYFRRVFGRSRALEAIVFLWLDLISVLGSRVRFGNQSVVHLKAN